MKAVVYLIQIYNSSVVNYDEKLVIALLGKSFNEYQSLDQWRINGCFFVPRSGDKSSRFMFGARPDRQPKDSNHEVHDSSPDLFKQLRRETEERNKQFLLSVFNRVSKSVS